MHVEFLHFFTHYSERKKMNKSVYFNFNSKIVEGVGLVMRFRLLETLKTPDIF